MLFAQVSFQSWIPLTTTITAPKCCYFGNYYNRVDISTHLQSFSDLREIVLLTQTIDMWDQNIFHSGGHKPNLSLGQCHPLAPWTSIFKNWAWPSPSFGLFFSGQKWQCLVKRVELGGFLIGVPPSWIWLRGTLTGSHLHKAYPALSSDFI